MRKIDNRAIEDLGIPSLVLMESAGVCVADEIEQRFPDGILKVTVICGPGNNGGDGMVISRHLSDRGHEVVTFLAAPRSSYKKDAKVQLKTISKLNLPVITIPKSGNLETLRKRISESEIVVDALFGTGMERDVGGIYADLVEIISSAAGTVFSVDIPSGLNGLTGLPLGTAVTADVTVSLAYPKLGLVLFPGASYAGEVVVGDIGIPEAATDGLTIEGSTVEPVDVCEAFTERWPDTHKGTYGHLLVVAGSTGRAGAGILTSNGALRSGTGLVTLALPSSAVTAADAVALEVMTEPLPETLEGTISHAGLQAIMSLLDDMDALAIGPGLTVHEETSRLVLDVLASTDLPVVIDADALNALDGELKLIQARGGHTVLTPHPGEMGRLLGVSTAQVQADRVGAAQKCAKKSGAVVVLKGARTIVTQPDGSYYINMTGNPGMATAGSGDVLTGMIGALLARGLDPIASSLASVFLHGAAGDHAADRMTEHSVTAGDLLEDIGPTLKNILTETLC